ncbi:uncharacterized protein AMSG_11695 [Thecamonas trahens ATCC 50062]|uniref:Right handed beta helix domain-containing protein n=1 Tax=Thecamonas trahens ATCC 50062 TaxID=461836 RepID=A0A0L0DVE5_THETB|nr:hypothetical protein AMSG_11695 [Thecamonas trahens ATCC 50062]KNC56185.1 hypothetical protein AMSG_11695 [Thecamonas trahens ATCC 50062]|eukprot:XP_013761234.1 hypothetical protein AMSG_11695 [Thecamonas trahens ATCC 50062]
MCVFFFLLLFILSTTATLPTRLTSGLPPCSTAPIQLDPLPALTVTGKDVFQLPTMPSCTSRDQRLPSASSSWVAYCSWAVVLTAYDLERNATTVIARPSQEDKAFGSMTLAFVDSDNWIDIVVAELTGVGAGQAASGTLVVLRGTSDVNQFLPAVELIPPSTAPAVFISSLFMPGQMLSAMPVIKPTFPLVLATAGVDPAAGESVAHAVVLTHPFPAPAAVVNISTYTYIDESFTGVCVVDMYTLLVLHNGVVTAYASPISPTPFRPIRLYPKSDPLGPLFTAMAALDDINADGLGDAVAAGYNNYRVDSGVVLLVLSNGSPGLFRTAHVSSGDPGVGVFDSDGHPTVIFGTKLGLSTTTPATVFSARIDVAPGSPAPIYGLSRLYANSHIDAVGMVTAPRGSNVSTTPFAFIHACGNGGLCGSTARPPSGPTPRTFLALALPGEPLQANPTGVSWVTGLIDDDTEPDIVAFAGGAIITFINAVAANAADPDIPAWSRVVGPALPAPAVLAQPLVTATLSDIDGDGDLDVVCSVVDLALVGELSSLYMLLNTGGGTWAPPSAMTDASQFALDAGTVYGLAFTDTPLPGFVVVGHTGPTAPSRVLLAVPNSAHPTETYTLSSVLPELAVAPPGLRPVTLPSTLPRLTDLLVVTAPPSPHLLAIATNPGTGGGKWTSAAVHAPILDDQLLVDVAVGSLLGTAYDDAALLATDASSRSVVLVFLSQTPTSPPTAQLTLPTAEPASCSLVGMGQLAAEAGGQNALVDVFVLCSSLLMVYSQEPRGHFVQQPSAVVALATDSLVTRHKVLDIDGNGYHDILVASDANIYGILQWPSPWAEHNFEPRTLTPQTLACLATSISAASRCARDTLVLDTFASTCRHTTHWHISRSALILGTGRASSGINCFADDGSPHGVLFSIGSQKALLLSNMTLAGAGVATGSVYGSSAFRLSGSHALLRLDNALVTSFDNKAALASPASFLAPGAGAVASMDGSATLDARGTEFHSIVAGSKGGLVYINSHNAAHFSRVTLSKCIVSGVSSVLGGAFYVESNGRITASESLFEHCAASEFGGVFYLGPDGIAMLAYSRMVSNTAYGFGGVFFLQGGMFMSEDNMYLDNSAMFGGLVAVIGPDLGSPAALFQFPAVSNIRPTGYGKAFTATTFERDVINSSTASYGALFFTCGVRFGFGDSVTGAGNVASIGGGAVFACPSADGVPLTLDKVVIGDDARVLARLASAVGYGDTVATPATAIFGHATRSP